MNLSLEIIELPKEPSERSHNFKLNGREIGYAQTWTVGETQTIYSFEIDVEELQNYGFGTYYYKMFEFEWRKSGIKKILVEDIDLNDRAIHFWKKMGFNDTDKTVNGEHPIFMKKL